MIGIITMVQQDNVFVLWEDGVETSEAGCFSLQVNDLVVWSKEAQVVILHDKRCSWENAQTLYSEMELINHD